MRKCDTCKAVAQGQHSLYCHAAPPSVLLEANGSMSSTFPPVTPDMYCLAHKYSLSLLWRKIRGK